MILNTQCSYYNIIITRNPSKINTRKKVYIYYYIIHVLYMQTFDSCNMYQCIICYMHIAFSIYARFIILCFNNIKYG